MNSSQSSSAPNSQGLAEDPVLKWERQYRQQPRRSGKRRGLGCLVVVLAVMAGLTVSWRLWFPLIAAYLDVSELPRQADFIVTLSGGSGHLAPDGHWVSNREFEAAKLYQEGMAATIILSVYSGEDGVKAAKDDLARAGVPGNAILVNDKPTSTWDEAQQLLDMLRANHAHSAIIVTDAYHIRRARATFRRLQTDPAIDLIFVACPAAFDYSTWWDSEDGRAAIGDEYAKIVYYLFHYGVLPW
jgi:uncharacterized SAM-binding protein YcdF (DUF218 family)